MEIKSLSNKVKEFGSKVKRDGPSGYYEYIGKNFTAKFNSEECETKWWEVNLDCESLDPSVLESFRDGNNFERKADVVWNLLQLDMSISSKL